MTKRAFNNLMVFLQIVIIFFIVTIGYMFIYANNPITELASFVMTFNVDMQNKTAPGLVGITDWINTKNNQAIDLSDLIGKKVVLVDFWTYSCINCQRSVPYVESWYEKYKDQGFVVIGVNTPEFRFEQKLGNVKQAVVDYGITYPVALDNSYKSWRAYHNRYWPAKYLIDKDGNIAYMRFGEGAYDATETKIQELLAKLPGNSQ